MIHNNYIQKWIKWSKGSSFSIFNQYLPLIPPHYPFKLTHMVDYPQQSGVMAVNGEEHLIKYNKKVN